MIMLFPQVIIAQGYALKGSLPEEIQGIDSHFWHLKAKLFKYFAKEKTFEHIFYDSQPKPARGLDEI